MEAAEVLHQLGLHPKRTLRVIAWMDEESGGAGSRAYTADHTNDFRITLLQSSPTAARRIPSDSNRASARPQRTS